MSLEDNQNSSSADGQQIHLNEAETENLSPTENVEQNQAVKTSDVEIKSDKVSSVDQEKEIIDQDLYKEVLEKLDIIKKDKNQDIQEKSMQDKTQEANLNKTQKIEKSQAQVQIENVVVQDFIKIQKLMQSGLINSVQGQNLKQQVLKKAFDKLVQTEKINKNLSPASLPQGNTVNKQEVFEEFSKSNPDFFTSDGRKEVLDYLKSDGIFVGKDDLEKISTMVRAVEKAAIDRYLKNVVYEKNLKESNDVAKQKLTANAQKTSFSGSLSRNFTREQIGKMSSAEFTKYESSIMEQLKKWLIRLKSG